MLSAIATSVLIDIAGKVGAPVVKGLLEKFVGGKAADIGGTIIDAIADKAGVKPEQLPGLPEPQLRDAIARTELEAPELIAAYVEQQRESNRLQLAEMETGPTWTWAWRPFWMWMLAFIWTYAFVLRPIVNAVAGANIEALDLGVLMTLTVAYLGLYMGGHTVKAIAGKGNA